MILILLHIECPIKWTLNFYWFNADKKDWKTKMVCTLCISSTWPSNSSNALSLDTLFDIAAALDVAPQKFLAFEDWFDPIIAYIVDNGCHSFPFSDFFLEELTPSFYAVRFFFPLGILLFLCYGVLLQGGETYERYPVRLHTMNPVGRENMQRLIERYWK